MLEDLPKGEEAGLDALPKFVFLSENDPNPEVLPNGEEAALKFFAVLPKLLVLFPPPKVAAGLLLAKLLAVLLPKLVLLVLPNPPVFVLPNPPELVVPKLLVFELPKLVVLEFVLPKLFVFAVPKVLVEPNAGAVPKDAV